MKRADKEELVSVLATIFNDAQVGYLVDYRGLTVEEVNDLRRQLHEVDTNMRVLKNRIAKRAIKDTPFEPLADQLVDTRALVYGAEPVAPAKVLVKFQAQQEKLQVLCGLLLTGIRGTVLGEVEVRALSLLPSREQLVAQLLFLLQAPAQKLVGTLNEVPGKFVRTLAAIQEARATG